MQGMREGLRWYGPKDPVTLDHVHQTGASEVVTALHHIYDGRAWSREEVAAHKARIHAAGLGWNVVESIPVHNSIKIRGPERGRYIAAYQQSIRSLAAEGVRTICYNFMPVLDWTRTDLTWPMPSTGLALRFDAIDIAAYDIFVLARPGAEGDYPVARVAAARARFDTAAPGHFETVERNLIAGLPAAERHYDRAGFRGALAEYAGIGAADLAANLREFLQEIVPVAEEAGARMCIHPDDPPFPLFGLPRVVSTAADIRRILGAPDSPANGLTFCAGSLGVREDNDLLAIIAEFGPRIHFAHLRNVTREPDGSFHEADHLGGSSDMPAIVLALMREQARRQAEGRADWQITLRPDHGHLLADDIGKPGVNPGYSLIGRLRGLAELRGVMQGIMVAQR